MTKKAIKPILSALVLVVTVVVFTVYFIYHPEVFRTLGDVSYVTLLVLFMLYGLFIATLVHIQRATLDLCNVTLPRRESALLVMYSSIINFFGPLQSGPGFRAAYLKAKHNINLKKYTLATLVYYGFYALFSALQIAGYLFGWWLFLFAVLAFAASPLIIRFNKFKELKFQPVMYLALATFSQVMVQSVIYFVALKSLIPAVGYIQTLIYTGAANFALFVSITPGAIGFRESFLLFTQGLHGIAGSTIAAASVIDRSVYVVLLLGMAGIIFGMHANNQFKNIRSKSGTDK